MRLRFSQIWPFVLLDAIAALAAWLRWMCLSADLWFDEVWEPPPEVQFSAENGDLYRRAAAFRVTAFGGWGWDWYVYRRFVDAPYNEVEEPHTK